MKFLVFLGIIVFSFGTGSAANKALLNGLRKARAAYPGLIDCIPQALTVVFENGASLQFGKKNITPTETINPPVEIDWNADPGALYTLIVLDPDAPSRKNNYMSNIVFWEIVNIPGKNVAAGDTLIEYIGVAPPENYGPNRYFYFVFRQSELRDVSNEKRIGIHSADERFNFSLQNYAKEHKLGCPVAFNFFKSYFDPQSNKIYKQVDCCEELIS